MDDDVRLGGNSGPVRVAHAEVSALEVAHDSVDEPVGDPSLVPRAPALATLPESLDRELGALRADMADDLGDAVLPAQQVAKDERAEESGAAGEEDDLRACRRRWLGVDGRERLGEQLGVVRVLGVDGDFLCGGGRKAEVGGAQSVELVCEGADGRVVEDDAERCADGERGAQLEDEARGEDRVAAEVEEGLVERDRVRRRREQLEPDVVDRALGRGERLRGPRRVRRRGGGDRVGEWERGLVDLAVRVQRHARERHEDCRGQVSPFAHNLEKRTRTGGDAVARELRLEVLADVLDEPAVPAEALGDVGLASVVRLVAADESIERRAAGEQIGRAHV